MKPRYVGKKSVKKGSSDWTDADYVAYWLSRSIVNPVTGCWEWQGFRMAFMTGAGPQLGKGYAAGSYRGKRARIHRKVLEFKLGRPLGPKMQGHHTCDVPYCFNPDHLYEGTQRQNFRDMAERDRNAWAARTHCANGHEFTPENTRVITTGPRPGRKGTSYTYRQCKRCGIVRARIKAGWPKDLAESTPVGQFGYRPPEIDRDHSPQEVSHHE